LLGIVIEGGSIAAKVLAVAQNLQGTREIRDALLRRITPGTEPTTTEQRPYSPAAQEVLERATRYAKARRDEYTSSEHLLYGISLCQEDSVAVQALRDAGVDPASLEKHIVDVIGKPADTPPDDQRKLF